MTRMKRHPRWWQIGPFMLVMGILCFLEERAPLSTAGHIVVQLGSVLLVYGLLYLWVRANQGAWLVESWEAAARQRTVGTASEEEIELPPVTQEAE